MNTLLLVLLGFTSCYAYSVTPEQGLQSSRALLTLYREFQSQTDHEYDPAELSMRIKVFRNTLKRIAEVNSEGISWKAGLTKFADMTEEEMDNYRGVNASHFTKDIEVDKAVPTLLGSSLDWRDRGHVTPIKSQKGNSCWTFAAVTCIEGLFKGLSGQLVEFADQELMDCVYPDNNGREGRGHYARAFNWIKESGRLGLRSEAPHTGEFGTCDYEGKTNALEGYSVTEFRYAGEEGETSLVTGLAQGPVAVAIQTKGSKLDIYEGGIFRYSTCPGESADHALAAVGYTEEAIIIKNSWGTDWGEEGYLVWARGMDGHNCLLYAWGVYPVMAKSAVEEIEE